ncbi:MAG: LysR family transcriptional regulator [Candidatus Competibacterales bacterium]
MTLNYHHLRYFWAVAHEGNLTRTAERLSVSQSALSVQIQKLENALGHRLFERRGRQLLLTEAGRIALDYADAIFAVGDELVGVMKTGVGAARQVLRLGALATLSRNFQMDFFAPLLGRDDVELILRSGSLGDLLQQLDAHRLDAVLVNHLPLHDSATPWISHLIAEQPVGLVGTPRRVAQRRAVAALLHTEPVIVPTVESSIRTGFDALVDGLGLEPRLVAEVDDMAMVRLLARADVGLAVVPPIVVKDEIQAGQLVEAAQLPGLSEAFYAVTLSRRFPNPLLGQLMEYRGRGVFQGG